jgi:hypothetical protein
MPTAILVIWSIGLAGALLPTIVIFRTGRLVIGTLKDLLELSRTIDRAAHGIDRNVSVIPSVPDLRPAAQQLVDVTLAVERSLQSIARSAEHLQGTR